MGAFGKVGSQIADTLFDALSDKLTNKAATVESKKAAKSLIEGKKLNQKAINAANSLPIKAGEGVSKAQAAKNKKIRSMVQDSNVESAKETGRREIDVDPDTGRPTSIHIAPWDQGSKGFKKISKARKRALIAMGFARVDKNGKLRSTKKWADSSTSVKDSLGMMQENKLNQLSKGDYSDAEMKAMINKGGGFQMKKYGGKIVRRKTGGVIGGGAALRGFGATRRK